MSVERVAVVASRMNRAREEKRRAASAGSQRCVTADAPDGIDYQALHDAAETLPGIPEAPNDIGNLVVVTPLLDRLMHHGHLLKFEGKHWRLNRDRE